MVFSLTLQQFGAEVRERKEKKKIQAKAEHLGLARSVFGRWSTVLVDLAVWHVGWVSSCLLWQELPGSLSLIPAITNGHVLLLML